MGRVTFWILLGLALFATPNKEALASSNDGPSENECRPYIEKALNELKSEDSADKGNLGGLSSPQRSITDDYEAAEDEVLQRAKRAAQPGDLDGDGILDAEDSDKDGDGIPDNLDDDIDGDGLPNELDSDRDGDGIPNELDADIDGDGLPNEIDPDSDGNGELDLQIVDVIDDVPNERQLGDLDGDGIPDEHDTDKDGDGIPDESDTDIDGDGVPDDVDDDIDGDGIPNHIDEDMDGDGIPNDTDDDIDGDGVTNELLLSQAEAASEDNAPDQDGDGVPDATDGDIDGDGIPNELDLAPEDKAEDDLNAGDIDADGIPDTEDVDKDGDGVLDVNDSDIDGDGIPNDADADRDGDGVPEAPKTSDDEAQSETENEQLERKETSSEADMDGDGVPDHRDSDIDGDGIPNAIDSDKDGDGVQDSVEKKDDDQVSAEREEAEGADAEQSVIELAEPAREEADDVKPEDELLWEGEIPQNRRSRDHLVEILQLDDRFDGREKAVDSVAAVILKDIKRIYENAIHPLETLYKYRDLSNRHFGDPEIFSKPLILFMGPWSGGKSSILNYLTDNEYSPHSLTTGAEPSPAYFNILMWGNKTEVLDGTQLAADYTFAGLQKFGQGLEERLRGLKLRSKLLEKVNIVEIPGILEVRKQVSRIFPFNDACQWFIDRADIIFLVYDPAKLDVGPETEAILDQLKGREYQTRIILNKADTVKPEELLRVQSALIWNISPLMSSAQPPLLYTTSLWSNPYQEGAPARLLLAQERAFLRDFRTAIDKRIEHKISSARRFAVRVRNHAKMVDCYLNTYYNHKTIFGNRKRISEDIINNPQNYHIYEGLSTLTNISRYDLPDPEVYRDFFRLNPLYEFKKLTETCTYFRGCPISKLDVAIAYDLPELAGKYKKLSEEALSKVIIQEDNNDSS